MPIWWEHSLGYKYRPECGLCTMQHELEVPCRISCSCMQLRVLVLSRAAYSRRQNCQTAGTDRRRLRRGGGRGRVCAEGKRGEGAESQFTEYAPLYAAPLSSSLQVCAAKRCGSQQRTAHTTMVPVYIYMHRFTQNLNCEIRLLVKS